MGRQIYVERPWLPNTIDNPTIRHLGVGDASVDLHLQRFGGRLVGYLDERHEGLAPLVVRS